VKVLPRVPRLYQVAADLIPAPPTPSRRQSGRNEGRGGGKDARVTFERFKGVARLLFGGKCFACTFLLVPINRLKKTRVTETRPRRDSISASVSYQRLPFDFHYSSRDFKRHTIMQGVTIDNYQRDKNERNEEFA